MINLIYIATATIFIPFTIAGGFLTPASIPASPIGSLKNLVPISNGNIDVGCGLNFMVGGSVSPLKESGYANLCLQCRVNVFGNQVGFAYTNYLAETISTHGVSASDSSKLQAYVQTQLVSAAAKCSTKAQCSLGCAQNQFCSTYSFTEGRCSLIAKSIASNNKNGQLLASAFQGVFNQGGNAYCGFCSSDSSCLAPSARARRSLHDAELLKRGDKPAKCPSGLTACPITFGNQTAVEVAKNPLASDAYECLDVQEELNSCGGCATLGEGVDCMAIEGVESAGCSAGKCHTFSCKTGFTLSKKTKTCVPHSRSNLLRQHLSPR